MYGMSYDDYWNNSDSSLFWAYFEAHNIKLIEKRDYDNELAWLSGLYVRNAIGSSLSGEEYPKALDYKELERKASLPEEEKLKEEQQILVDNTHSQMMRVMASLKRKNMEVGE